MNCHLENNIRQINHTSLICFAMLEKNRINRNFGFLLSVFGFYRLCQYRLRFRFRLLKKPRFSVSVSVTDPALLQIIAAEAVLSAAQTQASRARLIAAAAPSSGAFLQAIPMSSVGTRLDNTYCRVTTSGCT